jgi:hypothetical protein
MKPVGSTCIWICLWKPVVEGTRSFGRYLAVNEARAKSPTNPESAGRDEWREDSSTMGPGIARMFRESRLAYPGKLHLYDVDTEQVRTITTNQGDSEVLLVENGIVYYRASDRLYSVPITEKGLGVARLLATDKVIRDTHWAFVKH